MRNAYNYVATSEKNIGQTFVSSWKIIVDIIFVRFEPILNWLLPRLSSYLDQFVVDWKHLN